MTERSKRLIIAAAAFALGITVGLSSVVIIKRNVKPLTVVKASGIDSAVNYNSVYKVMKKICTHGVGQYNLENKRIQQG